MTNLNKDSALADCDGTFVEALSGDCLGLP
jgi:hypothetical protein